MFLISIAKNGVLDKDGAINTRKTRPFAEVQNSVRYPSPRPIGGYGQFLSFGINGVLNVKRVFFDVDF